MTRVSVRLLGGLQVGRGASGPAVPITAKKTRALLAYLALQPGRAHVRDQLTALLWPDVSDANARQSLRQALVGLRQAFTLSMARGLIADGDTVALDPSRVDVDVSRFERLVADGTRTRLEEAAILYRGDLLEGLHVKAPPFEEWLLTERERLRELARQALAKLLAHQSRAGATEVAIHTASRLLALDPLQEEVHRTLMRLYVAQGQRAPALRQYQSCLGILRRELDVEPEAATKRLYQEILQQPMNRLVATALPQRPRSGPTRGAARSEHGRLHGEPALIGRDAEVARLRRARDDAWNGRPRMVLLTGEAGIGKTRVLGEVAAEAAVAGGRVLVGRFHETEQVLPFQAWIDALRGGDVLASLDDLGAWRADLARLFPELGPPPRGGGSQVRLLEAMLGVVDRLAVRQGLLLVLEDLHWADEMSVRLLSFIGRRIQGRPVLLVGSAREEDLPEARVLQQALEELDREGRLLRLVLSPLSQVHTVELVRALLRRGTAEASVERVGEEIWRMSEGNPFVIVESLRELPERAPDGVTGRIPLPERVRGLITARLGQLGERSRHLAHVAAVVGREAGFPLLQRSSGFGPAETAERLEELVSRRLLTAVDERFDFTHERVRRVVYEGLLAPRRAALHAAVGEALESLHAGRLEEVYDQLSHHYALAGVTIKAVDYLTELAVIARRRYALEESVRMFDKILAMAETLPEPGRERRRLHLVLEKAFALSGLARFTEILDLLLRDRDRVERLGDSTVAGPFFFRLALTRSYLGQQREAAEAARRAMTEAERSGDRTIAGRAHYVLALKSYFEGEPRSGIEDALQAIALLEGTDQEFWLGLACWVLATHHIMTGELEPARRATADARTLGTITGEARLQSMAATAQGWALAAGGDPEGAIEACRRALDLSRDPIATAGACVILGYANLEKEDYTAALAALQPTTERLLSFGMSHGAGRAMAFLAEAHLGNGDLARAAEVAEQAVSICQEGGSRWALGWAQRTLARVTRARGLPEDARPRLAEALATFSAIDARLETARTRLELASLAHVLGDPAMARSALAEAEAEFRSLDLPIHTARAIDLGRSLGIVMAPT